MFFVLNKKTLRLLFLFCVIVLSSFFVSASTKIVSSSPADKYCVVLDAGHGGIDCGSVGKSGVFERDLNLSITQKLKKLLSTLNILVVETRKTQDGLYKTFASGFKQKDMKERKKIIDSSNADLVVSIHMNYFKDSSAHGAQVFYKPGCQKSKILAKTTQDLFQKNLYKARKEALKGDFYILTCSEIPGILVECGYLSNNEEEALLITEEYQNKLAYQIFCGIVSFFDIKTIENN